ncbi:MAG: hypothetical protein WAM29_04140 [Methylocella sp.]
MGIFVEIADQWQIAENAFSALEQVAFAANDDASYDAADEQRKRNDQAYFLYLFTRFEGAVNHAVTIIIGNRVSGAAWSDRRIWEAWSRQGISNVHFMSKVEVLTEKSLRHYAIVKEYYDGRNSVAHGGIWSEQFLIPEIAQMIENICKSFPTN